MKRTATVLVALALVSACGEVRPIAEPLDPTGGWQLVAGVVDGQTIIPIDSHPVTLNLEDGVIGGTSACNSYGGEYSVDGATITVGEIVMTEMACIPQEVMDLESQYLGGMMDVSSFAIDGTNLVLSGDGVEFEFEPEVAAPTAEMLGTIWVLETLISGETASSVAGERATLEFFSDGSFLGGTGCRNLSGNYVETATGVATTDLTVAGLCSDDLAAQDNSVVTLLEGDYAVDVEGQSMTLTNSGDEGLVYRAET
ncbi:MAG TPA: META domain-containing protein [Acidimicrobiia bacterium]